MDSVKFENGRLTLLDQSRLPINIEYLQCEDYRCVAQGIRNMKVRGAPAIGVAAAYGVVLAAQEFRNCPSTEFVSNLKQAVDELRQTRPTAVNLFWALDRMTGVMEDNLFLEVSALVERLEAEAAAIQKEDLEMNMKMAEYGCTLITEPVNILTHCNAGALATAGYGTALGVVRCAWSKGKVKMVYADETRPLLQGARLTAFELMEDGIPVTLITDNMAGYFMQRGKIDCVIVGADRIAANGDTANKIGTYGVAVLAKHHGIPFYVAAPSSTFDLSLQRGQDIIIEERNPDEVRKIGDIYIAPPKVEVVNPAFDVTPHSLISAIITDQGVIKPDYSINIKRMLANGN